MEKIDVMNVVPMVNASQDEIEREFREYQKKADDELRRFRFLSVDEIYSMTGPTDWLVKSYLDKGSLAMFFGKSDTL